MFDNINKLIEAISHLLWPLFAFSLVWTYKEELRDLLKRLKKGKLFGNEVEFDKEIDAFKKSVEKTQQEIPENTQYRADSKDVDSILISSIPDPKIGLLILAREIEKELRELIASMGLLEGRRYQSVRDFFLILDRRGALPKHTLGSVEIFLKLRNEVVHGKTIENDDEVIRVLDIGMTLLNTLKSIPHEINTVYKADISIFSDPDCTKLREDVKGLILETVSPGGVEKTHRIFPSTQLNYYKVNERVSWEWDLSKIWNESWYIDPDTKEKKSAWLGSGEFIGRHLNEIF